MAEANPSHPDVKSESPPQPGAPGYALSWMALGAALLGVVLCIGAFAKKSASNSCENEEDGIWFVHATDPHLFISPTKAGREEQQKQNQEALSDMLKYAGSLPEGDSLPAFLLLTGDLGVDPCDIRQAGNQPSTATPTPTLQRNAQPGAEGDEAARPEAVSVDECLKVIPQRREDQIKATARTLGESPIQDIYLIAGNNDIATESAGDPALKYFNDFIQDVQKELIKNKSNVQLHHLTRCYLSGEPSAACYADIPHSAYRLIGFPSYSFKNSDEKTQAAQFEKLRQLLADSRKQGMKALVITHTPEMDDPFALAEQRYVNPTSTSPETTAPVATITPIETVAPARTAISAESPTPIGTATPATKKKPQTQTDKSSSVATWNLSKELLDQWKVMVASDSMAGVFAGHLHDSHKEIYRQPFTWSSGSPAAFRKLFLAPPLAVKNQDKSPVQARGFSLVHLRPDRIESRLFWYDSVTRAFTPDPQPKPRHRKHESSGGSSQRLQAAIGWLWDLEKIDSPLVRMAVLLIAFLTAFLTVVAIWQIPPASDPFAEEKRTATDPSKPAPATSNAGDSLPFSNRFGKTVIAGLAGLVAAEVTKTLGNEKPSPDSRWYYIVWFILFFFFLLLSLNLWRAAVEALRARVAVVYYPPAKRGNDLLGLLGYWLIERPGQWLGSLRVPLITFSDTFVNLIQGKNQTRTIVFEKRIIDQQRTVVRVAEAIRTSLNRLIEGQVLHDRAKSGESQSLLDQRVRVRVNISVLSREQTNVFYIARAPGSAHSKFPKRSVAWASVFTGQPLWYLSEYKKPDEFYNKIILFEKEGAIPDEKGPILLKDYLQPRSQEDYQAFIILPVPSPRRGFGSDYVKGAIQISFLASEDFAAIWRTDQMKPGDPPIYRTPQRTLEDWCIHHDIRAALNNSIAALGELLRGFNEIIYQNYIENPPD